jgi:hypothetical protein
MLHSGMLHFAFRDTIVSNVESVFILAFFSITTVLAGGGTTLLKGLHAQQRALKTEVTRK